MSNLLKRVLVAIVGIPIVILAIFGSPYIIGVLVLIINILAIGELFDFLKSTESFKYKSITAVFSTLLIVFISNFNFESALIIIFVLFLVLSIISIRNFSKFIINDITFSFFSIAYISLPLSCLLLIKTGGLFGLVVNESNSNWLVFSIFVGVWICDSFAYFGGKLFGKRPLAKFISPKKTIEGALSGFIGASIFSLIVGILLFQSYLIGIILAFNTGILGQFGDLFESAIKRKFGVKDSSSLIPGHGGILDRIDSLLFSIPTTYILIKLLL